MLSLPECAAGHKAGYEAQAGGEAVPSAPPLGPPDLCSLWAVGGAAGRATGQMHLLVRSGAM